MNSPGDGAEEDVGIPMGEVERLPRTASAGLFVSCGSIHATTLDAPDAKGSFGGDGNGGWWAAIFFFTISADCKCGREDAEDEEENAEEAARHGERSAGEEAEETEEPREVVEKRREKERETMEWAESARDRFPVVSSGTTGRSSSSSSSVGCRTPALLPFSPFVSPREGVEARGRCGTRPPGLRRHPASVRRAFPPSIGWEGRGGSSSSDRRGVSPIKPRRAAAAPAVAVVVGGGKLHPLHSPGAAP